MESHTRFIVGALVSLVAFGPFESGRADRPSPLVVVVERGMAKDGLVVGKLSANGQSLGTCFENAEKKIPAGKYKGVLRYKSEKNFVQGPGGNLGMTGDFLLEVANVPRRTNILFHAGNKAKQSEGCVMCGPATKEPSTGNWIAPEPLRKLRLLFYGTDQPNSTPDRAISIEIRE